MNIPRPDNEKRRLEVLWQCDILDSPSEQPFDDLTELASLACDTPVALISLVDENRQWFKARVGTSLTETDREGSFCTHAILQKSVMVVPDARQDPRFASNPMVTGSPFIRFYAGAPLIDPEGCILGTLCVLDQEPRELTEKQLEMLRVLSRLVMNQIETRRQVRELARVPIRQRSAN